MGLISRISHCFRPLQRLKYPVDSGHVKSAMGMVSSGGIARTPSPGARSFSIAKPTSLTSFFSQIMPPSSRRSEVLSEVTLVRSNYIDLPISTEAKSEFQKKFRDLLRHYLDVSGNHPSSGYFYQHYSAYKQSIECPIPAVFLAILKMEHKCVQGAQFVACCESIFLKAAKVLPSIGMKRLFYFHFMYHAAKPIATLNAAHAYEGPKQQPLLFESVSDSLQKISEQLLSQIEESAFSDYVPGDAGYTWARKKYTEFLTSNPKTQLLSVRLVPDGVAQDLFQVSDRAVTCSGRAIMGTLDSIGLVYGALEIAEKYVLSSYENPEQCLLLSAIFSYYYHAKYSPQYLSDYTQELRWLEGLSLPFSSVSSADLNALVVHSDNFMSDLCEQKKLPATAYIKFEKALSKTTLSRETYLSLTTLMYQCHRLSLENMLIQDGLLDIQQSLFSRDAQGDAMFSREENRFLWSPVVAEDFSLFSKYALSGEVPASAPVFVGYHGTLKEYGERIQETGAFDLSKSLGDQDLDAGIYMTPCVSVAQRFAMSAIRLNVVYGTLAHDRIVPAVFSVFLPFSGINRETGLPLNSFFYNPNRDRGVSLAGYNVVHNPHIRNFPNVAELRIKQLAGISLHPCPISNVFFKTINPTGLSSYYYPVFGSA